MHQRSGWLGLPAVLRLARPRHPALALPRQPAPAPARHAAPRAKDPRRSRSVLFTPRRAAPVARGEAFRGERGIVQVMRQAAPAAARRPRPIAVRGTSGAELGRRLVLPCVELDALHHGPDWSAPTPEECRARVRGDDGGARRVDERRQSRREVGDLVVGAVDTLVWLDLPPGVKLRRFWRRTMHKIRDDVERWNGNRETWRGAFVDGPPLAGRAGRAVARLVLILPTRRIPCPAL